MKKTFLIPINQGFAARLILQTELFRTLQRDGHRIILLVPDTESTYFVPFKAYPNVVLEKYRMKEYHDYLYNSGVERRLLPLRYFIQNGNFNIQTVDDVYKAYLKDHAERLSSGFGPLKKLVLHSIVSAARRFKWIRLGILWMEQTFFTPNIHQQTFEKFKPDLLITTSLGTFNYDQFLIREARTHGVKSAAVILSWDNTTTRGMPGAEPDFVVAWTENMKRELIDLNDVPEGKIFVGGVPHYDYYYEEKNLLNRDELFEKLGLDRNKKMIFFVTKSPNGYAWNANVARLILEGIRDGRIDKNSQLLVRMHPIYYRQNMGVRTFESFLNQFYDLKKEFPDLIINEPQLASERLNYSMPESEIFLLASMLKHSDVVVNMFSTINIEASIFDVPIVNVSFEGGAFSGKAKARYNIKMDEDQTHNQRVIQTGGLTMVYSANDLAPAVNAYLKDRSLHREGRKKIFEGETGPHRGAAGATIARHLLQSISENRI